MGQPNTTDLDAVLLGPSFATHTPESFVDYVNSLRQLRELDKPVKAPRVKKQQYIHEAPEGSMTCIHCGKKVRKIGAKCAGPQQSTTGNSEIPVAVSP